MFDLIQYFLIVDGFGDQYCPFACFMYRNCVTTGVNNFHICATANCDLRSWNTIEFY